MGDTIIAARFDEDLVYRGVSMKIFAGLVILQLALALAEPAYAQEKQYTTVQSYLLYCKSYLNGNATFDQGLCMGAIEASLGYLAALCAFGPEGTRQLGANIPTTMSYGALIQTYINWAEANPNLWAENVGVGMASAFRLNFPCDQ